VDKPNIIKEAPADSKENPEIISHMRLILSTKLAIKRRDINSIIKCVAKPQLEIGMPNKSEYFETNTLSQLI